MFYDQYRTTPTLYSQIKLNLNSIKTLTRILYPKETHSSRKINLARKPICQCLRDNLLQEISMKNVCSSFFNSHPISPFRVILNTLGKTSEMIVTHPFLFHHKNSKLLTYNFHVFSKNSANFIGCLKWYMIINEFGTVNIISDRLTSIQLYDWSKISIIYLFFLITTKLLI